MTFILLFLLFLAIPVHASDPYALIDAFLPKEKMPRILNSQDIPILPEKNALPLFSPIGDFNKDGVEDMAISGIYGFPGGGNRYFLLVGTILKNPVRYEKLYFEEMAFPLFIHKPGSTGEGDQGDQAFSISTCTQCEHGIDFYWDRKEFKKRAWKPLEKRGVRLVETPAPQVPDEAADKAFQVVGRLNDVKRYIERLKKKGAHLGVRVEPDKEKDEIIWVKIFEKERGPKDLYDSIGVHVGEMKVVKRLKKRGSPRLEAAPNSGQ